MIIQQNQQEDMVTIMVMQADADVNNIENRDCSKQHCSSDTEYDQSKLLKQ